MKALALLTLLICVLGCACHTTTTSRAAGPDQAVFARCTPVRGWEVRDDGRLLGSLVRYDAPGDAAHGYYSVRNSAGQELGIVDFDGRAWRYRAHERESEWLGTGTVLEGVQRILAGSWATSLDEVGLEALAAPR